MFTLNFAVLHNKTVLSKTVRPGLLQAISVLHYETIYGNALEKTQTKNSKLPLRCWKTIEIIKLYDFKVQTLSRS